MSHEELPRVTTVLDLLNKPYLIPWAARLGVEHMQKMFVSKFLNPIVSIANETKDMALIKGPEMVENFDKIKSVTGEFLVDSDEMIKIAKSQHKITKKAQGDKGRRIHTAIEGFLRAEDGAEMEVDEDIEYPMSRFLSWWISSEVEPVEMEFPVWSEDGGGWRGTLDYAGKIKINKDAKRIFYLVDFKSGPRIYQESFMQLAAYFYGFKQRTEHILERAAILRLPYSGQEEFRPVPEAELYVHYKRFIKLVEYWHLSKGIK